MKTQGRIEDGQVIIALSFGKRGREYNKNGFEYSKYGNSNIAHHTQDIYSELEGNLPVILQKEVAEASKGWMFGNEKMTIAIIKKHRIEGKDLDIFEVLAQAAEIMKKNKWSKVILIAHPGQIWRVKKILEKMELKVIIPSGLEDIPFDPYSREWWTRNWFLWVVREIPLRLIFLKRKWI